MRPKYRGYAGSKFRTKITQSTRVCEVTGPRLSYFKRYLRPVDRGYMRSKLTSSQRLIEVTGASRSSVN